MLWGASEGGLEVRVDKDGSHRISGRFPYGAEAELSPRRREVFAPGAFRRRIASGADIHLLAQHDYGRPLASTRAGSLELDDSADALAFTARIAPEIAETSHGRDALAMIRAALASGLSPGFMVPAGGEDIAEDGDGLRRTIRAADLHELSIVTRPAYPTAQVEARCWRPSMPRPAHRRRLWL